MPGMLSLDPSKMEIWLARRLKNRQREKIFHEVFASGCFGNTSGAKNFDSSELAGGDIVVTRNVDDFRDLLPADRIQNWIDQAY
jgi:hypothetical protein